MKTVSVICVFKCLLLVSSLSVSARGQSTLVTLATPTPTPSPDDSSGPNVANIIGFAVVLVFLLIAFCVVILMCCKYGTCKALINWTPLRRNSVRRTQSHLVRTPHTTRHFSRVQKQADKLEAVSAINPRLQSLQEQPPMSPQHSSTLPSAPVTPNQVNQARPNSVPSSVTAFGKGGRVPPLQIDTTDFPPPYPGVGYPYQPCKSPRTPRAVKQSSTTGPRPRSHSRTPVHSTQLQEAETQNYKPGPQFPSPSPDTPPPPPPPPLPHITSTQV